MESVMDHVQEVYPHVLWRPPAPYSDLEEPAVIDSDGVPTLLVPISAERGLTYRRVGLRGRGGASRHARGDRRDLHYPRPRVRGLVWPRRRGLHKRAACRRAGASPERIR
jgi:hypothetical protein